MKSHHDSGNQYIAEAQLVPDGRFDVPPPEEGGVKFHDLLYVIFNHKWKIILLGLLGLGGASAVYFSQVPLFASEAKLFVPYVLDRNLQENAADTISSAAGYAGRSVLNVEIDLFTSWDLLEKVAESVGVDKILPEAGDAATGAEAARVLANNLKVFVPPDSMVINASYQNADPAEARRVLQALVTEYLIKHKETHRSERSIAMVELKESETKTKLADARAKLQALKQGQNIISLQSRETALGTQQSALEGELLATEAKRAEQEVRLLAAEALAKASGEKRDPAADVPSAGPTAQDVEDFRSQVTLVQSLTAKKNELELTFTGSHGLIRTIETKLAAAEAKKKQLVDKFPAFATAAAVAVGEESAPVDPRKEREALNSLNARIEFLKQEREKLNTELSGLMVAGSEIRRLEREITDLEANYQYYKNSLDRANVDKSLKATDLENITVIQQPSVAGRVTSPAARKLMMALGFGGFALGLALAFLIEFLFDRSIKRPQEFDSKLQLPLMLSIPFLTSSRKSQLRLAAAESSGSEDGSEIAVKAPSRRGDRSSPWQPGHFIRPFANAVRDRIGYHFHINGITHKPKLIGLTGFSDGAGTSTLAAALAASFAEMTDGKILYLNLNCGTPLPDAGNGEESSGNAGPVTSGQDSFGTIENQNNLFIATITPGKSGPTLTDAENDAASRAFIPKRLYELMPRLRASDFEYVIFDMPTLSPTSPTLSIAGFMDKVLMVVDAGKTDRDVVRRSFRELTGKANADVSMILNKTRETLPSWLQG